MKKFIISATVLWCLAGCKDNMPLAEAVSLTSNNSNSKPLTPVILLNPAGESWKLAYKATGSEENQLLHVKFEPGGNFHFVYHTSEDATVQLKGQVSFTKRYGKDVFTLKPLNGTRTSEGSTGVIPANELQKEYAKEYLWEKVSFKDMPSEDFLLLVDIKAHPMAGASRTAIADRSWVSKFYSRK